MVSHLQLQVPLNCDGNDSTWDHGCFWEMHPCLENTWLTSTNDRWRCSDNLFDNIYYLSKCITKQTSALKKTHCFFIIHFFYWALFNCHQLPCVWNNTAHIFPNKTLKLLETVSDLAAHSSVNQHNVSEIYKPTNAAYSKLCHQHSRNTLSAN